MTLAVRLVAPSETRWGPSPGNRAHFRPVHVPPARAWGPPSPSAFCSQQRSWEAREIHRLCPRGSFSAEVREGRAPKCWAWGSQVLQEGAGTEGEEESRSRGGRGASGMYVIEPQVTEEGTRRAGGARPLLRACSLGPAWALLPHVGSHSPPLPGAVLSRRSRSVAVESSHYGRRGPALPHLADQMSSMFIERSST